LGRDAFWAIFFTNSSGRPGCDPAEVGAHLDFQDGEAASLHVTPDGEPAIVVAPQDGVVPCLREQVAAVVDWDLLKGLQQYNVLISNIPTK
jgi:hypothetical protein